MNLFFTRMDDCCVSAVPSTAQLCGSNGRSKVELDEMCPDQLRPADSLCPPHPAPPDVFFKFRGAL